MGWMKPLSVAAVLTLTAAPAFAQHTRGGGNGEARGQAESRGTAESGGGGHVRGGQPQARGEASQQGRGTAPQGRATAPPVQSVAPPANIPQQPLPASRPQADGRAVPRGAVPAAPPGVAPNVNGGGQANSTDGYRNGSGYRNGNGAPAPIGRSYDGSRGGYINTPPHGGYAVPHSHYSHAYPQVYRYGYGYRPRVVVPVVPYYRPYYTFRPHFNVGFGIYLGYPVPYPYAYGYPGYIYGGGGSYDPYYDVAPSAGSYGGISFDISPSDADVYIDGNYVGRVGDFSPMYQPLTVTPGRHQVELDAPNCEPLVFEVDIQPGQVLPYRGELRRY